MIEKTRTNIRASPETLQQLHQLKDEMKARNINTVLQKLIEEHKHGKD
jgi:hypothetical protein